ncbi:MAG: glycine betaine/L-proline ABC transporter substrate-binding protein ProX [Acidimicrobiia bacterium]|nr:glycine betaine/L-proline ABC transporter substrate-binding protein ProX [Acidimicrobiia bacterium]
MKKRTLLWLALLAAFALFVAACGDDAPVTTTPDTTPDTTPEESSMAEEEPSMAEEEPSMAEEEPSMAEEEPSMTEEEPSMTEEEPSMTEVSMTPGEGSSANMGRADWTTGYFQAQVFKQMLEELGYDVSEPSELELGPSLAYLGMSQGDFDFWVNSWYPGHVSWWSSELPDGSTVGDHLTIVGNQMTAGGLQGYLITKSFADEYGVTHLDQLNDDPEILAAFDADDQSPGNGVADIYGCTESWTCDNIIDSQIAFSDWTNIAQVKAGYDAMFAEATTKADAGEPMVIYTWTPSAYITQLRPSDNVVWLAVEDVVDDSNPTGIEGGEGHDQTPGQANIGPDSCPAAANADNCQLGWVAADIQVTANTDWLNANPYAAELFCRATLSVIDVSLANVDQSNAGDDATEDFIAGLAADWIADNRDQVDGWLEAARTPPMEPSCPDTVIPLALQ